jgi:transmembrane sensor
MAEVENIVRFPDANVVEAEAAEWLVRLDSGTLSGEEMASYQEWLGRSPLHRDSFQRLAVLWQDLEAVKVYSEPLPGNAPTVTFRLSSWRWRQLVAAAAVLLVLLTGSVVYRNWPEPPAPVVAYETAVGGQQTVVLADGSTMLLNTASRVEVVYSRSERAVRLVRGEAFFDVAHDQSRPFTVISGGRQVRDLGTAFVVRQAGKSLEVTVTKGAVELAVAADTTQRLAMLSAGQSAAFDHTLAYVKRLSASELDRQLSWRGGVLVYSGEPLGDVVSDISRYTNVKISLSSPTLASLPVGGYFEIGKIRTIFEALESNFGIRAEWIDESHVRLIADHRMMAHRIVR